MPIQKYGFREFFRNYFPMNKFHLKKLSLSRTIAIIVIPLMFVTVAVVSTIVAKGKQQAENAEVSQPGIVTSNTEQSPISADSNVSSDEENDSNSPSIPKSYDEILAIGDSVMLDIAPTLDKIYPNITIDGKVGRQLYQAIELAPTYAAFNATNRAVIIELGTNAYFTDDQIDKLLDSFKKAHIYLVNVRVPRQWEKQVNNALSKKAKERDNVTLIDWYSAAIDHPEYFVSDGVHLQPKGIEALTSLIEQSLKENISVK
jgi:hypothetical protein